MKENEEDLRKIFNHEWRDDLVESIWFSRNGKKIVSISRVNQDDSTNLKIKLYEIEDPLIFDCFSKLIIFQKEKIIRLSSR